MTYLNSLLFVGNINYPLIEITFRLLDCHLLWVMGIGEDSLKIWSTDWFVMDYYRDKRYYLEDPSVHRNHKNKFGWKITLGTNCETFNKNGFLYDLYKIFGIEEFVSIETEVEKKIYCVRFFTTSNRFVFVNNLLNNIAIIKHVIYAIVKKLKKNPPITLELTR